MSANAAHGIKKVFSRANANMPTGGNRRTVESLGQRYVPHLKLEPAVVVYYPIQNMRTNTLCYAQTRSRRELDPKHNDKP
jgi:hypothetical protein